MSHIIRLPKNMSYYPSHDMKEDGKPVMVFNISKTQVHMIPELLKGVDRVVVRPGQLKYIAPDYAGQVAIFTEEHIPGKIIRRETLMDAAQIQGMKRAYQRQCGISADIFEQSYSYQNICRAYPDEEMNLPAKLKFTWNPQELVGNLNAGRTWIQEMPVILNIDQVIMPNKEKLIRRYRQEAKDRKRLSRWDKYADHKYVAIRTGLFQR